MVAYTQRCALKSNIIILYINFWNPTLSLRSSSSIIKSLPYSRHRPASPVSARRALWPCFQSPRTFNTC